jgi:predicted nucleotidyltransferase
LAAEHAEVSEVRLFGSLARGDATGISDVDVLLVLCESDEKDPIRRILRYLPFFNLDRGVDLLVYTRDELRRAVEGGNPFLRRALDESVLLFPAAGSNAG